MNKQYGLRVGIKFTEELTGDITGTGASNLDEYKYYRLLINSNWSNSNYLNVINFELYENARRITPEEISNVSADDFSSATYPPSNVLLPDSTYWSVSTAMPHWLQFELTVPTLITHIKWRATSYLLRDVVWQGSMDEENWLTIFSAEAENLSGWSKQPKGNEKAFVLSSEEYDFVGGTLVPKEYLVESVERKQLDVLHNVSLEEGILIDTQIFQGNLVLGLEEE